MQDTLQRSTLQGRLNYLGAMDRRPFIDVNDFSLNKLTLEAHTVPVEDARPLLATLSLEEQGFILVRQKLPTNDWDNPDSLVRDYQPAMNALVQQVTGADHVYGTDEPIVRKASLREVNAVRPAPFVHADFTPVGARDLVERSADPAIARLAPDLFDTEPGRRRYRRALIVQSWRVVTPPPHDVPLAVCAANSVSDADIVAGDYVIRFSANEELHSETAFYHRNPAHRWYHFADLQPDEVLLFMGYDFFDPERAKVPHTGFRDKSCPPDAVGRISIEARTIAVFDA